MAAQISCNALHIPVVNKVTHLCVLTLGMARRLTVSETLHSVFELDVGSNESELEEDPRFPLPVAFSDDKTF